MGVNSLPQTHTRQCCDCDLNPGPSAPESSTLTTRLPSHIKQTVDQMIHEFLPASNRNSEITWQVGKHGMREVERLVLAAAFGWRKPLQTYTASEWAFYRGCRTEAWSLVIWMMSTWRTRDNHRCVFLFHCQHVLIHYPIKTVYWILAVSNGWIKQTHKKYLDSRTCLC